MYDQIREKKNNNYHQGDEMKHIEADALTGHYNDLTPNEFLSAAENLSPLQKHILSRLTDGASQIEIERETSTRRPKLVEALKCICETFDGKPLQDIVEVARENDFEEAAANARIFALSPQEINTIEHLMHGESRAQAAHEMEISEATLRTYIETARQKLAADNTHNLCAMARQNGIGEEIDYRETAHLSPRETETMCGLAQGLSRSEISEELGIKEHTLRAYIDNAAANLGFHGQGNKSVMLSVAAVDMFGDHAFAPLDECLDNITQAQSQDTQADDSLEDDTRLG